MSKKFNDLLNKYFLDCMTDEEFKAFETMLEEDAECRQKYLEYTMMDAGLRSHSKEGMEVVSIKEKKNYLAWIAAAAAMLLLVPVIFIFNKTDSIAVIKSSEQAGWESSQATLPGSELHAGILNLRTGIATLAFHSGADLTLVAPAKIELISEMEIKVISGNISMYVRESAQGFRVNTPNGYAIDHGTRFSVRVSEDKQTAIFKVQEGEISLHHDSGKVKHLTDKKASEMNSKALVDFKDPEFEGFLDQKQRSHILSSVGHENTVIVNNDKDRLNENFLMVKNQKRSEKVNRRALFAFKVDRLDLTKLKNARLSLNSVPTGLGEVVTMPTESTFQLFGIADGQDEQWKRSGFLKWADSPKIENAIPLATFKISRAKLRTKVLIESDKLLDFIKSDKSAELSFIISCKTKGGTLVHGFASSINPEASGPRLELIMEED